MLVWLARQGSATNARLLPTYHHSLITTGAPCPQPPHAQRPQLLHRETYLSVARRLSLALAAALASCTREARHRQRATGRRRVGCGSSSSGGNTTSPCRPPRASPAPPAPAVPSESSATAAAADLMGPAQVSSDLMAASRALKAVSLSFCGSRAGTSTRCGRHACDPRPARPPQPLPLPAPVEHATGSERSTVRHPLDSTHGVRFMPHLNHQRREERVGFLE